MKSAFSWPSSHQLALSLPSVGTRAQARVPAGNEYPLQVSHASNQADTDPQNTRSLVRDRKHMSVKGSRGRGRRCCSPCG